MSKGFYFGVDDAAHKSKKMYYGVDGVARKVKKAYIGVDGVARQFYSGAIEVTYTGTHSISNVTVDGVAYKLYTLKKTGTLTISDPVQAWACGGGNTGGDGNYTDYRIEHPSGSSYCSFSGSAGGGGGGGYVNESTLSAGTYTVTIGSAGGVTKFVSGSTTTISASAGRAGSQCLGGNGGSGGGNATSSSMVTSAGISTNQGKGNRKTTYPFGITSLKAHCAGGSAGSFYDRSYISRGGKGGTNGGDGGNKVGNLSATIANGVGNTGGTYGGGQGGDAMSSTHPNGRAATFYGGGGGGGAARYASRITSTETSQTGVGNVGYQGVAYLLVPA